MKIILNLDKEATKESQYGIYKQPNDERAKLVNLGIIGINKEELELSDTIELDIEIE